MSAVAVRLDTSPASLPVAVLLDALAALDVSFTRRGEGLALANAAVLTGELRVSVREHKPDLLALADRRATFTRLCERACRLRCEDPKKGTRHDAIAWLGRQVQALAASCDLVDGEGQAVGFSDPSDPFAGDQITHLLHEIADLIQGEGLYPLGALTDDPLGMDPPRLLNGKLAA